jgi:hypothetical protein
MHSVSDEHTVNVSRDSNLMALIGGLKDRIIGKHHDHSPITGFLIGVL